MVDLNVMANNIKNILGTVPGIKETFDHEPQSINNLPAATVFFDSFSQIESTTRRSILIWQWTIRIYIPLNTNNVKESQQKVKDFVMGTINQFRSDITLSGICLYQSVTNGDVFALLDQNSPMLVAELTLSVTTQE